MWLLWELSLILLLEARLSCGTDLTDEALAAQNVTLDDTGRWKNHVLVICPDNDALLFGCKKVRPALDVAVRHLKERHLLDPSHLEFHVADSKCDDSHGALAAFHYKRHDRLHCFIGPLCDFSLSHVALYAPEWEVPVITPGGLDAEFTLDERYSTLTRVGVMAKKITDVILSIMDQGSWRRFAAISDPYYESHLCHFAYSYFKVVLKKTSKYTITPIEFRKSVESILRDKIGNSYSVMTTADHSTTNHLHDNILGQRYWTLATGKDK